MHRFHQAQGEDGADQPLNHSLKEKRHLDEAVRGADEQHQLDFLLPRIIGELDGVGYD